MIRLISLEFDKIEIPRKILARLDQQTLLTFFFMMISSICNTATDVIYTISLHSEDKDWMNRFYTLLLPMHFSIMVSFAVVLTLTYKCGVYFHGMTFIEGFIVLAIKYEQWCRTYSDYADIAPSYSLCYALLF